MRSSLERYSFDLGAIYVQWSIYYAVALRGFLLSREYTEGLLILVEPSYNKGSWEVIDMGDIVGEVVRL